MNECTNPGVKKNFALRFSDDEKEAIHTAAQRLGLTISAFVRMAALEAARKQEAKP